MGRNLSRRYIRSRVAAALACILMAAIVAGFSIISTEASYADGDDGYIFGTSEEFSTAGNEFLKDSFYGKDEWFAEDPTKRNDGLALLSMQLTAAAVDDDENGSGAKFLKKLGFGDIGFVGFHTEDPDDCAYTWGKKTVGEGADAYTLIAIVVQSGTTDQAIKKKGWTQNFIVNGETASGEHYALGKAADTVLGKAADLAGSTDKVKYWIIGHSRGGALANLISAKLPGALEGKNPSIYTYTFESPAVIQPESGQDVEKDYGYIHNYICDDDIVPMVPPEAWGMKLYGNTYKLNTEETDAALKEELEAIGSSLECSDSEPQVNGADIVAKLVSVIPTRADYSAANKDTFNAISGEQVTIEYSYQDLLSKLMGIIFGGEFSLDGISDHLNDALASVEPFIVGYMAEVGKYEYDGDPSALYWEAAQNLCNVLDSVDGKTGNLPFDTRDAYALLKLAGSNIVNPDAGDMDESCKIVDGKVPEGAALAYLLPGITIAGNTSDLIFSHHFDSAIARLKALAPAPAVDEIALNIPAPEAGDMVSKAPRDVTAAVDDLGYPWLDASCKWDTDNPTLKNNKRYYLVLTLYVSSHSIPDDFRLTLNGKAPDFVFDQTNKDGLAVIRAAFAFDFGTPKQYTVSFDSEHGTTPESMTLPDGTPLKYITKPDAGTQKGFVFDDWYGSDMVRWDEITVNEDIEMTAKWKKIIDNIKLTVTRPSVGKAAKRPAVPIDAPYHVSDVILSDSNGYAVKKAKKIEKMSMGFYVVPDSDDYVFAMDEDENYAGKITVNGKKTDYYMDYRFNIGVNYKFTPKGKANTLKAKGKTVNVSYKKLAKKAQSIKRSKAIKISKAKGKVTYKKVKVSMVGGAKAKGAKAGGAKAGGAKAKGAKAKGAKTGGAKAGGAKAGGAKASKKLGKKFQINKKTGKITVKKGLKRGTYKVTIKVTAAGNSKYEKASKKVTVKIVVR